MYQRKVFLVFINSKLTDPSVLVETRLATPVPLPYETNRSSHSTQVETLIGTPVEVEVNPTSPVPSSPMTFSPKCIPLSHHPSCVSYTGVVRVSVYGIRSPIEPPLILSLT